MLAATAPDPAASATDLLSIFNTLGEVLAADRHILASLVGTAAADHIELVRQTQLHCLSREVRQRPLLANMDAVLAYMRASLGQAREEQLRIFFLNGRNFLLHEMEFPGSVDEAPASARAIIKRGLDVGALGMILMHNHPSGVAHPSNADREFTLRIARLARPLDLTLHDHLIVAGNAYFSFREQGLI